MIITPFDTDFTLSHACQMLLIPDFFSTPRIAIFNPHPKMIDSITVRLCLDIYMFDCFTGHTKPIEFNLEDQVEGDLWQHQEKTELEVLWRAPSQEIILVFHDKANTVLGVKMEEVNCEENSTSYQIKRVRLIRQTPTSRMFFWEHVFYDSAKDQLLFVTTKNVRDTSYFEIRRASFESDSTTSPVVGKGKERLYRWRSPATATCFDEKGRRIMFFGGVDFDKPLPLKASNDHFCFLVDEGRWAKIDSDTPRPSPRMGAPNSLLEHYWFVGGADFWVYNLVTNRWMRLSTQTNKWNKMIDRLCAYRSSSREIRALLARIDDHSSCLYVLHGIGKEGAQDEVIVRQSTHQVVNQLRHLLHGERVSQEKL